MGTMNQHHHEKTPKRDRHWLRHPALWIPVLLMLVAMAMYVMTMDESLQPGGPQQAPVPAAP